MIDNGAAQPTDVILFTEDDLFDYLDVRTRGLTRGSKVTVEMVTKFIWQQTKGIISHQSLLALSEFYTKKYPSRSMLQKCFIYTRAFLKYLYKIRMDVRLLSYLALLENPTGRKEIKLMTPRIVTQLDIQHVIERIDKERTSGNLPLNVTDSYIAILLFAAYTGQRPCTLDRLKVGQIRQALQIDPPVITVEPYQDKIRMAHYIPIHPKLVNILQAQIEGKKDDDMIFAKLSFERWLKKAKISLSYVNRDGKFCLGDCRKFFEQKSDEIGFTDANKAYIMTHGVSGIQWSNYKAFLPENVYARYIDYWKEVIV